MGLSKDSMESLDAASRGAFLHLSTSEARAMLDRISGKTLLVKQGQCLIELVERLPALAFMMNSSRRNHLPIREKKF